MSNLLVIICGPTASGKTHLAIELAKHFGSEIISADSRQIYRETTIGTAVPSAGELQEIPHHFVQHISIFDYFNAFMYETEVLTLLKKLFPGINPVIMAGGSGMYIDAVCYGIDDIPIVDPAIRQKMKDLYTREGIEGLRLRLKKLDPDYYARVDLRNPRRLLKALEISYQSGRPYSSFLSQPHKQRPFHILKIGLYLPREELYNRINKRVDKMMEKGLVEEARALYPHKEVNALNTVGYKEIFDYLDLQTSLEETIDRIKRNTRKYARKQLTWFRRDKDIYWFHPGETEKIIACIENEMQRTNHNLA